MQSESQTADEHCVNTCMTASIRECDCRCGGKNHGILTTERLGDFSERPFKGETWNQREARLNGLMA